MESSTESQEARERLESWKRQQRDHGRLCYGPTTAEVLEDSPDDYPPSLNEAGFATRPWFKQKHLQLLLDLLLDGAMKLTASMPPAWDVSKDIAVMNMLLQFNDELPLTVGADHHVYAVSTFHDSDIGRSIRKATSFTYLHLDLTRILAGKEIYLVQPPRKPVYA